MLKLCQLVEAFCVSDRRASINAPLPAVKMSPELPSRRHANRSVRPGQTGEGVLRTLEKGDRISSSTPFVGEVAVACAHRLSLAARLHLSGL
jgi:hypothetical protein